MLKQLQFLLLTASFFFVACNTSNTSKDTYFGGKIINPKSDKIVLYSKEEPIDTFYLDENNKFFSKINVDEGLYYFIHGDENQYIYLEPQDSLLIRLNTWDFDESLVFAGKGADRNNILIDCFLQTENDNKLFYKYYKLVPKKFKFKIDSLLKIKQFTLEQYKINHPKETESYNKVLEVALTYPLFARLERYPLVYAKYNNKENFPDLENDFYNFRNSVEFNNNSLMYYPPYSSYILNYLYNKTYSLGHSPTEKLYSADFTTDLLNNIHAELDSETTKNAILKQTLISHFYNKSTCDISNKSFERFFELSSNKEDKEQIQNLINDTKAIVTNKPIPDFKIEDYAKASHNIHDVIKNKNVLLFFWNPKNVSESYIKSRMEYLENKYTNIDFIQIKIVGDLDKRIQNLDIKNQYFLNPNSEAHKFLTSKLPRSILINRNGDVINGYASISSYNLKPYLKELNKY